MHLAHHFPGNIGACPISRVPQAVTDPDRAVRFAVVGGGCTALTAAFDLVLAILRVLSQRPIACSTARLTSTRAR